MLQLPERICDRGPSLFGFVINLWYCTMTVELTECKDICL